jgi:hypothetical protein
MRRLPEVGLVVLLLLGLSGCAGLQQRLSWSSPSTTDAGRTDTPPPSRFSWWRQPGVELSATQRYMSGPVKSGKATPDTVDTKLPLNSWPDPPSDGFSRYFPMLSLGWDRASTERVEATSTGRSNLSQVSARSGATTHPPFALDDQAVRPVKAPDAAGSGTDREKSVLGQQGSGMSSLVPASGRPYALPEPIADVELDISSRATPPNDPPTSTEPRPTTVVSLQPGVGMIASMAGRGTVEADSVLEQSQSKSESEPGETLVPDIDNVPGPLAIAAADNFQPAGVETITTDSNLEAAPASNLEAGADAQPDQAHVPPAIAQSQPPEPPLVPSPARTRIPPAPSPTLEPARTAPADATQPSVVPSQPIAPVNRPKDQGKIPSQPPPGQTQPTPPLPATAPSTPVLLPAQNQASVSATGQRPLATSVQPPAALPPPIATLRPRPSFFGWIGFKLEPEPLASAQLPPATFPPSYYQLRAPAPDAHRVSPTPQGNTTACPPAPKFGGWKPVLIPALIKKIKNLGNACGCQCCHQEGATSSCQSCTCVGVRNPTVSASPQTRSAATGRIPAS